MADDDLEREEIASLLKVLEPERRPRTPGRRWTSARLLMPEAPRRESRRVLAMPSAIQWPNWSWISIPVVTAEKWNVLAARMWVGLGVVFSASMLYWPYARAGSWGLLVYLCAVALVVLNGIWGAKLTWDARLGGAHTVAVGVMVWGLLLGVAEVLPIIGSHGVGG